MRAREYTFRDMDRILKYNGYRPDRKKGDHHIYSDINGKTITINARVNRMVARRVIKENNLIEPK